MDMLPSTSEGKLSNMLDNFTFHQERRIVSQTAAEMKGIPPMKARKTPEILPTKMSEISIVFY